MFIYRQAIRQAQEYRSTVLVPLWVLMWKYLIARRHRYIYTVWEFFAGVTVFLILFLVNQTVSYKLIQGMQKINESDGGLTRLFYTPHNSFTQRLMSKVWINLHNNNIDSDLVPSKLHWDFENDDVAIPNVGSLNSSDSIAVVNFKNNGSVARDFNLVYSIYVLGGETVNEMDMMFNGFFHSIMPKEDTSPPFLGTLQWAIDKAYMEQHSGHDIKQIVQMRAKQEYISREIRTLHKFMILCTILAPLPFFLINSSRLAEERRSGLKEVMKLSGISANVLRCSHLMQTTIVAILNAVPVTLILKTSPSKVKPLLPYSNGIIIFITMVLHFVNSASLAFVTTILTQDRNHADSLGLLLYVAPFFLDFLWHSNNLSRVVIDILCCLLPHTPVYMFWDQVLYLERLGQGIQFWNIRQASSKDCMPVMKVLSFFCIHLSVIISLAWYLDQVRPGRYGVSKKWNFMFKKAYWHFFKKKTVNFHVTAEQTVHLKRDKRYFEKGPRRAEIAIKLLNITKIFKPSRKSDTPKVALDSVSFDCYKGEVTVLLGANGAGKTTLMSIVTGMFSSTKGIVYIHGKDVACRIRDLQEDLALCPQKNLNFEFLTVRENIMFFLKLKERTHVGFSIDQLMKKLKLHDKAKLYTKQLNNGNLRCLQVACALAGGANVLVLDEPTSGMDVELRHRLWDLIMVLRGKKTILMTTTFLEEANALGDRIVILDNGKLRCHGTPMFLKEAIGVSFNLNITIKNSTQMKHLKEIVEKIIPDVRHRIHDIRRITFSLPSKDNEKFPKMFDILEENKKNLGITLMDVGMFMEEVLLEFIEEEPSEEQIVRTSLSYRHIELFRKQGCSLKMKQFLLLIKRVYKHSWLKKYHFIIFQVLVPVIGLIIITLTTNHRLGYDNLFGHNIPNQRIRALVYNTGPYRRTGLINTVKNYPGLQTLYAEDIDNDFTNASVGHMSKGIIGLKMTDHYTRIFHSQDPHILSKSINMYSNIYMTMHMPYHNHSITTTFERQRNPKKIVPPKTAFLCLKWSVWVVYLSVLPLAPLIILCITEYRAGIRDNHMMAGCSPLIHWSAKLLAHLSEYLAIIPVPVLIFTLLLDLDRTFNQMQFLGSLLAILLAFGPAFLTHLYLLSFIFHDHVALCHIYLMSLCFGIILPIATSVLEPLRETNIFLSIIFIIIVVISRFSPLFVFAVGLSRLALQARLNAYCRLNKPLCPDLIPDVNSFSSKVCCESKSRTPFKYLASYDAGLYEFINLIVQFLFYSILVLLLEKRTIHYILEQIIHCRYKKPPLFQEPNVLREKEYVETALKYGPLPTDVLLVDDVHKTFSNVFNRQTVFQAIKGISFAAKLGECIAILGPQGSGKTTFLEMLAGSRVMTRGNVRIAGHFIRKHRAEYIHKISLTSPTAGLDDFLTGQDNLVFIAKLLGYSEEMAIKLSLLSLRFMGLRPSPIAISKYSAGCLRRLSLCNTLVLAPLVALLDEPMRETDANTKPLVAKALQRLVLEPAVVVLTEDSVDWRQMQPVFSRIALMSKGQLAAIGPAEEVIAGLAKGYTARIKLKVFTAYREDRGKRLSTFNLEPIESSSESDSDEEATMHSEKSVVYAHGVVAFKNEFRKIFKTSTITGEHLCMLYFDIPDDDKTLQYSEMFQILEQLKLKYDDVVEDYILSSTTVEDVFFRLAYEMHEGKKHGHHHHSHHDHSHHGHDLDHKDSHHKSLPE